MVRCVPAQPGHRRRGTQLHRLGTARPSIDTRARHPADRQIAAEDPWSPDDVALLPQQARSSNPRVTRYIGLGHTWTALKAITVSDRAVSHWREHGFGWRVAINVASGSELGLIALNQMGPGTTGLDPEEHEIGWWISPDHWGYGYASEGARAVADDAFSALDAPHLTARILPENVASIRVAAALGMEFEFNAVAEPGAFRVGLYRGARPGDGRRRRCRRRRSDTRRLAERLEPPDTCQTAQALNKPAATYSPRPFQAKYHRR